MPPKKPNAVDRLKKMVDDVTNDLECVKSVADSIISQEESAAKMDLVEEVRHLSNQVNNLETTIDILKQDIMRELETIRQLAGAERLIPYPVYPPKRWPYVEPYVEPWRPTWICDTSTGSQADEGKYNILSSNAVGKQGWQVSYKVNM